MSYARDNCTSSLTSMFTQWTGSCSLFQEEVPDHRTERRRRIHRLVPKRTSPGTRWNQETLLERHLQKFPGFYEDSHQKTFTNGCGRFQTIGASKDGRLRMEGDTRFVVVLGIV